MSAHASSFTCPTADGQYSDPDDCGAFFSCSNGIAYKFNCPAGLHFDQANVRCDYKDIVNCGATDGSGADGNFVQMDDPDDDSNTDANTATFQPCLKPTGLFPDPFNCSRFYSCFQNIPRIMNCSANLHFNAKLKVCDFQFRAKCVALPLPTKATETTTAAVAQSTTPKAQPSSNTTKIVDVTTQTQESSD